MNVDAYLRRIGYYGHGAPTLETLRELHSLHMLSVPFENLDIHFGNRIIVDENRFFDKIVLRRRGGFCYELNGLFAALLREMGFDVTLLAAQVWDDGRPGPEFDHMTLLVRFNEPWLADVGFGDSFIEPLPLRNGFEEIQRGTAYRIETSGGTWTLKEHRQPGGGWNVLYTFDLQPRQLSDYAPMCDYHQTSPDSHFTQKRACSMATRDGRVTVSDMKLIVTKNGVRTETILPDQTAWNEALAVYFGIERL